MFRLGNPSIKAQGAHAVSSADTLWLVDLLSFPRLTVDLFANEILGDFGEIGGEGAAQFLELGLETVLIALFRWSFRSRCFLRSAMDLRAIFRTKLKRSCFSECRMESADKRRAAREEMFAHGQEKRVYFSYQRMHAGLR